MNRISAKRILVIFIVIMLIFFLGILLISYVLLNRTTLHSGLTINGIDVGGLNGMEAVERLRKSHQEDLENTDMVLIYDNYTYKAKYRDLGVKYDYYKAVEEGYGIGREGNSIHSLKDIITTRLYGKSISLDIIYDQEKIDRLVENIKKDLSINSENAKIEYVNGSFKTTPEVIGQSVNVKLLRSRIIAGLSNQGRVIIPIDKEIPKITEKALSKIEHSLSKYTTIFAGSSHGRKNNIKISAMKIDGQLIMPGEIFSFNKTTGSRSRENGYMESKVIIDGKFVNDIGGGVCQVSTTLYNAALRSNLEIVERYHHSLPVSYVPKGEDATVSYGYLDLKFKNNYDFPIYIRTIMTSYAVTFKMYGGSIGGNRQIDIVSVLEEKVKPQVEKKIDNSLAPWETQTIQEGRYGYKVKTYRVIYEDGKVVQRELISHDYYKPKNRILKVGPNASKQSSIQDNNNRGRLVQ